MVTDMTGAQHNAGGRATCYGLDGPGIEHRLSKDIFSSLHPFRAALGPTQPPLKLVQDSFLTVKPPEVLRRIFGPKRDEATGEWRRLHNEELNDLYSSPNIIRVVKSRRMRWAGHVARMGKREVHRGFWWGDLREGTTWETQA
jgi:hypothetical protein